MVLYFFWRFFLYFRVCFGSGVVQLMLFFDIFLFDLFLVYVVLFFPFFKKIDLFFRFLCILWFSCLVVFDVYFIFFNLVFYLVFVIYLVLLLGFGPSFSLFFISYFLYLLYLVKYVYYYFNNCLFCVWLNPQMR